MLFWISQPKNTSQNQALGTATSAKLAAEESAFDFGSISMKKGTVNHRFKIKNTTDTAITITKLYTSCMCTTATLEIGDKKQGPFGMPGHGGSVPAIKESLAPNQDAVVNVVFDPAAHGPAGVGKIKREILLESGSLTALQLNVTALVTP